MQAFLSPLAQTFTTAPLVVIDPAVDRYREWAYSTLDDAIVLILEPHQDGVEQITRAMQHYRQVTHLHIVAPTAPGCLYLGDTQLSRQTLEVYDLYLMSWFLSQSFKANCCLTLYSSNLATGTVGTELVQSLHNLTGATIAVSPRSLDSVWNITDSELNSIAPKSTVALEQTLEALGQLTSACYNHLNIC